MAGKMRVSAKIGRSGRNAIGGLIVNGQKVEIQITDSLDKTSTGKTRSKRCSGCSRKKRNA